MAAASERNTMGWGILSGSLLLLNLWGICLCAVDKRRAKRQAWRIRERTFFIAALLGAGPGVWAGMYLCHHKTKHWYFVVFIPLITIVEYGAGIWAMLRYVV